MSSGFAEEGGGRRQTAVEKKLLFKFLDAVPRHEVEGDVVVEVVGGGRCSRVNARGS